MKTAPELGRTQLFWFFMHAQIGVGLFSLPYSIYKHAQTDGWISLLIAGVVVQLVFFFLVCAPQTISTGFFVYDL